MRRLADPNWRLALYKAKRQLATMTDEEDAEITAGALSDPDNPPWPDAKLSRMRPAIEVMPEVVAAYRRRRGPQTAPTKQLVSLRLDRDVIAHFRKRGTGWQRRINEALRKAARLKPKDSGITSPQARRRPPRDR